MRQRLGHFAMGVAGMVVALSLWHLWIDHRDFHALMNFVVSAQQQAAKDPPTTPGR